MGGIQYHSFPEIEDRLWLLLFLLDFDPVVVNLLVSVFLDVLKNCGLRHAQYIPQTLEVGFIAIF